MPAEVLSHDLTSHEARLQRVEAGFSEVAVGLATTAAKLESLDEKLVASTDVIGSKLDKNSACIDKMSAHLERSNGRLEKLEAWRKDHEIARSRVRKVVMAAFIAAAGGLGTLAIDGLARILK